MAEEILDAEQEAVLLILDRGDPPRLALADDVGQVRSKNEGFWWSEPVIQKSRW